MNRKNDYIAVFDSGVGGISVLRHLVRLMPRERFLYYGDNANAPYGTRPTPEIRQLTLNAAKLLAEQGIKALVVACNTATAAAIEELRQAYPELIVVGTEPALKPAADRFPGGCIGVLATPATLREEKFRKLTAHYSGSCTVLPLPAPGLVELIEAGKADSPEAEALLQTILGPYKGKLDALVLGCTHYPFAKNAIRRVLGENVLLLDGGEGVARETHRRLENAGLLGSGKGALVWRTSCPDPNLLPLCQSLLEKE